MILNMRNHLLCQLSFSFFSIYLLLILISDSTLQAKKVVNEELTLSEEAKKESSKSSDDECWCDSVQCPEVFSMQECLEMNGQYLDARSSDSPKKCQCCDQCLVLRSKSTMDQNISIN